MSDILYARAAELMEAEIGDELVALATQAGVCFGFNRVATSVWRELKSPRSFGQLRDALLDEYEVEPKRCEEELRQLIGDMLVKRLIRKNSGGVSR